MTTRRYDISDSFDLATVKAKAAKLAQRAQAKGLSGGYTLTTVEEERPVVDDQGQIVPGARQIVTVLVIEGEPVKYDGWSFVAKVEFVNGLPVVTGSPWYEGPDVDRSLLTDGACDHCQTIRRRGKTLVVENEAGERKQVGTSCIKDFLGAEVTGAWYSDADPFEALESYGGGGRRETLTLTALALAATVIRQRGFIPAYKAEWGSTSTRADVGTLLGWGKAEYVKELRDELGDPTDADIQTATEALEFGLTMEGDSSYALNVKAVLAADWFDDKYLGLVVSVVGVMLKTRGELAEKAAEPVITEALYAEPKTKIELTAATVTEVFGFDTQWGFSRIFVFVAEGYRFKWMTSSDPGLAQGDVVDLKATVKGLDDYNGRISTALLRVKATVRQEVAA